MLTTETAEQLIDYETGEPFTAHTTNPVPFILVNADPAYTLRERMLGRHRSYTDRIMGMEQPAEMTGKSRWLRGCETEIYEKDYADRR